MANATEPSPSHFADPAAARTFVLAGNAIFTVSNDVTGERYTYRVRRKPSADDSRPAPIFVGLLTGPRNTRDYSYLGILDPDDAANSCLRMTKRSQFTEGSKPVQVFRWAMRNVLLANRDLPAGYSMMHAGRCGRCGRVLTVPSSIAAGIGPECAGKI